MKTYKELLWEGKRKLKQPKSTLPTIYCDMDQVLVDFIKGADAAVGGKGSFNQLQIKNRKDIAWKMINKNKTFWADLEWLTGGKTLWAFITQYQPHILSAAPRDSIVRSGKWNWIDKHLKKMDPKKVHIVVRSDKQKFALDRNGLPNVLIDDNEKNIQEWENKGGIGILHISLNETIKQLRKLGY